MATHFSVLRNFPLYILISVLLLFLAGSAQAQGTDTTTEASGEASVVIYDDFVRGKSETRYYLIDRSKGQEMRLFFKNGAPKSFTTGKKIKIRGKGHADGLDVESMTEMDDGSGSGTDQTSSAPVASAETRNVLTIIFPTGCPPVITTTSILPTVTS